MTFSIPSHHTNENLQPVVQYESQASFFKPTAGNWESFTTRFVFDPNFPSKSASTLEIPSFLKSAPKQPINSKLEPSYPPSGSKSIPEPFRFGIEPNPNAQTNRTRIPLSHSNSNATDPSASLDPELALLQLSSVSLNSNSLQHSTQNAPIFSGEVLSHFPGHFAQRSVLGSIVSQHAKNFPKNASNPKLYLNVNTPFSALICGLQGSGKSHSASVILEGCLLSDERIGTLPKPLSALSLHYDVGSVNHPCEPAYLAMPTQAPLGKSKIPVAPVTVLVSPTCLETMKKIYAPLKCVNVRPFYLSTANLNAGRMLSLMGFSTSEIMPLYLQRAMSILRQMGVDKFNYANFKNMMAREDLNEAQRCSFQMRIEMLDSYLTTKKSVDVASYFKPGHLVVVDLRDPFTTSSLVISLFEIVVGLFVDYKMDTGKILLLDEAHKYLNSDASSARFTESLTSLIRQQRHFGIRTIISTQEPTVVPNSILELVSFLILNRFTSPAWIKHLSKHISVDQDEDSNQNWPAAISTLGLGEAVLVSPSALSTQTGNGSVAPLSTGYLIMRTRRRLTYDGGVSIIAYDSQKRS